MDGSRRLPSLEGTSMLAQRGRRAGRDSRAASRRARGLVRGGQGGRGGRGGGGRGSAAGRGRPPERARHGGAHASSASFPARDPAVEWPLTAPLPAKPQARALATRGFCALHTAGCSHLRACLAGVPRDEDPDGQQAGSHGAAVRGHSQGLLRAKRAGVQQNLLPWHLELIVSALFPGRNSTTFFQKQTRCCAPVAPRVSRAGMTSASAQSHLEATADDATAVKALSATDAEADRRIESRLHNLSVVQVRINGLNTMAGAGLMMQSRSSCHPQSGCNSAQRTQYMVLCRSTCDGSASSMDVKNVAMTHAPDSLRRQL